MACRLPLTLPVPTALAVDVVTLGECSLDIVAVTEPAVAGRAGKTSLRSLDRRCGGQAATAAVGCARLGWRARFIGSVGDDEPGRFVEATLRDEGVDLAVVRNPGVPSRSAIILVDGATGERQVLESRDPRLNLASSDWLVQVATSGRVLLVDATDVAASTLAARSARAAGIPVIVDIDGQPAGADGLLQQIDLLVVTGDFAAACGGTGGVGEGLRTLTSQFRPAIAIATLGPAGSLALCQGEEILTPAFQVPVIDTTGAGDAFRAGLAAGWLRLGDQPDVEDLLRFANATAALNCGAAGAQGGLPRQAAVEALVTTGRYGQSN